MTRARDVHECAGRFAERREGRARAFAASAIRLLHAAMVQCTRSASTQGNAGWALADGALRGHGAVDQKLGNGVLGARVGAENVDPVSAAVDGEKC